MDKGEEAILTILEIEEIYNEQEIIGKELLISHQGKLLNKREVWKIVESLADKEDESDYWAFISKVKRNLRG